MSNEAFEKWAIDYGLDYESSFTRDDVEASWQAARADSEQEISELKSHINDLRDALERINDGAKGIAMSYIHKQCKEALLKTSAQHINNDVLIFTKDSLQDHNNKIKEVKCKTHPDAPHGFNRNESHSAGRYVCDCEFWENLQSEVDENGY